jgi:hypothetical protein
MNATERDALLAKVNGPLDPGDVHDVLRALVKALPVEEESLAEGVCPSPMAEQSAQQGIPSKEDCRKGPESPGHYGNAHHNRIGDDSVMTAGKDRHSSAPSQGRAEICPPDCDGCKPPPAPAERDDAWWRIKANDLMSRNLWTPRSKEWRRQYVLRLEAARTALAAAGGR